MPGGYELMQNETVQLHVNDVLVPQNSDGLILKVKSKENVKTG